MDQKTIVHLHSQILHSRKKGGAPTLCNSMDELESIMLREKPGSERQIAYDRTYKWFLINKTNKLAW